MAEISLQQRNALVTAIENDQLTDPKDLQSAAALIKQFDAEGQQQAGPQPTAAQINASPEFSQGQSAAFQSLGQGVVQQVQGLGQLATELAAKAGIRTEAEAEEYTNIVKRQREKFKADLVKKTPGITAEDAEDMIAVGEFLPSLAVPSVGAGGFLSSIAKNALLGGTVGAAQFVEDPTDRLSNALWGGFLGGGIGAIPGVGVGIKNTIFGRINKVANDPAVLARQAALDAAGIRYTLGQSSGDELLVGLETAAKGPAKRRFLFEQANDLKNSFNRTVAKIRGNSEVSKQGAAKAIQGELKRVRGELSGARNSAWKQGIERVKELGGDRKLIQPKKLLEAVDSVIREAEDVLTNAGGSKLTKGFRNYRATLAKMVKEGGATADEVNRLMVGLNRLTNKGAGGIFKKGAEAESAALAQGMRAGLFDDIADATQAAGGQADEAIEALNAVRANYKAASEAIQEMGDTAVASAFGKDKIPGPSEIKSLYNAMDPSEQRFVVDLLRDTDDAALASLRAGQLKEVADGALDFGKEAVKNAFDIKAFAKGLGKMRNSGLLSQRQVDDAMKTVSHARTLLNKVDGPLGNVPLLPKEMTINLVSQNAGFMVRAVTQLFTGSSLEKLLFTKAGQEAMRTAASTGASSAKMTAAAGVLVGMLSEEEGAEITQSGPSIGNLGAF